MSDNPLDTYEVETVRWSDTSDFAMSRFMREAYLAPNDPRVARGMNRIHKEYSLWFDPNQAILAVPWTENHLAGLLSSNVLLLQYLKADGLDRAIGRLRTFLQSRLTLGLSEIASATYLRFTLNALLNVVDFVQDGICASRARTLIDYILEVLAHTAHPKTGGTVCATTRSYIRNFTHDYSVNGKYADIAQWLFYAKKSDTYPVRSFVTSTYRIPDYVRHVVRVRTNLAAGTVYAHEVEPNPGVKGMIGSFPMWIQWSYGHYARGDSALKTLLFMSRRGLFKHDQFKSIPSFLGHPIVVSVLIMLGILATPILYPVVERFFRFSDILGVGIKTRTVRFQTTTVVATHLTGNVREFDMGAQQLHWSISTDSAVLSCILGTPAEGRKQLSASASQPRVTALENAGFLVEYRPRFLTLRNVGTGGLEITMLHDGFESVVPIDARVTAYVSGDVSILVARENEFTLRIIVRGRTN